jgi:hypothetical protein
MAGRLRLLIQPLPISYQVSILPRRLTPRIERTRVGRGEWNRRHYARSVDNGEN